MDRSGTWEGPVNVYQVKVEGPAGADWLQVRGRDESAARREIRRIVMPGVSIAEVQLVGTSERWAA